MDWRQVQPSNRERLRLAAIGHGSEHDLVARLLNAGLRSAESEGEVLSLQIEPEEFSACVDHLRDCGFTGIFVGNPHKPMAAKLATEFFTVKHALGVANVLMLGSKIYAQNTEVPAFVRHVEAIEPGAALVMGSGRAARSVVQGLLELGWQVRLWNRSVLRSRPFVTLFQRLGTIETIPSPDPSGCKLIVNATPIGAKTGEQPPVKWTRARPHTVVLDLVFREVSTDLLREAKQRGFRAVDGRELLVEQTALAFEWWTGKTLSRVPLRDAAGLRTTST